MADLKIDQALRQGVEAHKAGRMQEAERFYNTILKAQPKHPDANHNMGVLAVGVDKVHEALPFFKTALEANPGTAKFWLSYIDALTRLDKFIDAKVVLAQAKNKGAKGDGFDQLEQRLKKAGKKSLVASKTASNAPPQQSNILDALKLDQAIKLAKKKCKEGSPGEAKRIYQEILVKFPKNKRASDGLKGLSGGTVSKANKFQDPSQDQLQSLVNLFNQGQTALTLKRVRTLILQFPKSAILFNVEGAALQSLGQYEQSVVAYRKALTIRPDYADAYNNMGNALKNQGKLKEAIKSYNRSLVIKPENAEAYNNIGNALREQGELEDAIKAYTKALAIKPDYAEAYNNMGNALQDQGNLEEAIETYNKALALKPNYANAYYNMGNALKKLGELAKAIKIYQKSLSIRPDHADAYLNMGNAFKEQGWLGEAIKAYKKSLIIRPDYVDAHLNISDVLKNQDMLEDALGACSKALEINPNNFEALNNMGNILQEQGKVKEALNFYNKVLLSQPDHVKAMENCLSIETQLQGASSEINKVSNQTVKRSSRQFTGRPIYQIIKAISFFLSENQIQTHKHIKNFKAVSPEILAGLTVNEQIFCFTYEHYLSELLKEPFDKSTNPNIDKMIYHIGESHCLSYSQRTIQMNGEAFRIAPMITFGAKAFHFAQKRDNRQKAITRTNLASIPKGSKVFISFGEIDCRPNEGFIPTATKLHLSIEDIIFSTVSEYLKWFSTHNNVWNHSIYFFNIPAPVYNSDNSPGVNNDVANAVALFNAQIKKQIDKHGFSLIDVYRITLNQDGFSNNQFHIDGYHLGTGALLEIEKQLNS